MRAREGGGGDLTASRRRRVYACRVRLRQYTRTPHRNLWDLRLRQYTRTQHRNYDRMVVPQRMRVALEDGSTGLCVCVV